MDVEELKQQRRLLQQQLGLVDRRTERAALMLNRKRAAKPLPAGVETFAEHKKSEKSKVVSKSMGALTVPLSEACPVQMGGRIEKIRQRALIHRVDLTERRRDRDTKMIVPSPGQAGAYRKQTVEQPMFPTRYQRGELPCAIEHRASGNSLSWVCPLHNLDYEHYLPIFFDGVRCTEDPHKFMARQGAHELLEASRGYPERIMPCIPSLISPLRLALTTKDAGVVLAALHCIQELVMCNYGVGEAIVPFYRQLLAVLNLFFTKRSNLGDQMDYGQWKNEDLGAAVLETLELLEKTGGPHAYINIKYMVPAYESCCV